MKLQATGNSTKPDAQKVDPLLNHNGERGIEIYRNVHFAQRLQAPKKAKNNFEFLEKTGTITPPRLASLMLISLSVIPSQCWERTFGCIWREIQSRVLTRWWTLFGERPNECKLLKEFHEQAIREKITFSCTNDPSKLKLYDQGADLCLEKAIQILSLKETSRLELQGSNSATIDAIRSKGCGNCNLEHPPGKKVLSSSQTHAFVWNAGKLGTALLFAVVLRRNRLIK